MKILDPNKPKFPVLVYSNEEYVKKSEWLFKKGYKSYARRKIHEDVRGDWYPFPISIDYHEEINNQPFGLLINPNPKTK